MTQRTLTLSIGALLAGLALAACSGSGSGDGPSAAEQSSAEPTAQPRVGMLFAGQVDDSGFMQSGFEGLQRASEDFGVEYDYIDGIEPEPEQLESALRELADKDPDMVLAHGGQNNEAAERVAADYPDVMFVVTQGNVTGENLSSYEVLQEESAWLAGAAAGLLTETDVVGHMSGIEVTPGLKGRAAYAAGVEHTNPDARLLTNFSGSQDDQELAHDVAAAEIDEGADIIFTMLNAGRPGVATAMEEADGDVRQIGNVIDYTEVDPDVFVASAVADSGSAAYSAIQDFAEGDFEPGVVQQIGLEEPAAVRLALSPDVPDDVKTRLEELTAQIIDKEVEIPTEYSGPQFDPAS